MFKPLPCVLRFSGESLEDANYFASISEAMAEFEKDAIPLLSFGQYLEASIHILRNGEVQEYPDYVLSVTRNGNVKKEKAW